MMLQLKALFFVALSLMSVCALGLSFWSAYREHTSAPKHAMASKMIVANDYISKGGDPPWLSKYEQLVSHVRTDAGELLDGRWPCGSPDTDCSLRARVSEGSLLMRVTLPESDSKPFHPGIVFRDANLDGWPDEYLLLDGESVTDGECYEPTARLAAGYCRLPPRDSTHSSTDPSFPFFLNWMLSCEALLKWSPQP